MAWAANFIVFPIDSFRRRCYFCNIMLQMQHTRMRKDGHRNLSRRERQIMDILYQRGRATGAEILASLPDAPTYSAVRAKLRVLEEKVVVPAIRLFVKLAGTKPRALMLGSLLNTISTLGVLEETARKGVVPRTTL